MTTNDKFRMTKLVISFNRHFFAMALIACAIGAGVFYLIDHWLVRSIMLIGIFSGIYLMIASIVAGYFIYDHSDLYKLEKWPDRSFPTPPASAVIIHAGFDPVSGAFRSRFPDTDVRVLDFFTPEETTEASIQIAHRLNPPTGPQEHTQSDLWPVETGSLDAVLALTSAHEIRDDEK